ncbi:L-rhamnose/proton symporter RhaT [Shigella boydii]
MHEAAAALGVDHCMSLCQAMSSYGRCAIINLGFCFIRLGKSEGFVAKSRLLAGKTADYSQCVTRSTGGSMWYLQFFWTPGPTPHPRANDSSVGCCI